jgi:hypothetical protein
MSRTETRFLACRAYILHPSSTLYVWIHLHLEHPQPAQSALLRVHSHDTLIILISPSAGKSSAAEQTREELVDLFRCPCRIKWDGDGKVLGFFVHGVSAGDANDFLLISTHNAE